MSHKLLFPKSAAIFSEDRVYRYALYREWNQDKPKLIVIGLNPSTADETKDDPTIRRCIDFAKRWDKGGLIMLNLFGYRATNPVDMFNATVNPEGPRNIGVIKEICSKSQEEQILCAWGMNGEYLDQDEKVVKAIEESCAPIPRELFCLDYTLSGYPRHPLYVAKLTLPKLYDIKRKKYYEEYTEEEE